MASFNGNNGNNNMRRNATSNNSLIISPGNNSNNNDSPSPTNNMNENIIAQMDASFIEWGDDAGVSIVPSCMCACVRSSSLCIFVLLVHARGERDDE